MYNFEVITVPADGLAPLSARPSAGKAMTMFRFCIPVGQMLKRLTK